MSNSKRKVPRRRHLKVAATASGDVATASVSDVQPVQQPRRRVRPLRARARIAAELPECQWERPYLDELVRNGGQVVKAAEVANISRSSIAHRRETVPAFEKAEVDAMKYCFETAESEAKRRAIDGIECSWTSIDKDGTRHVHKETKYSDTIMLRLLVKLESGSWNEKRVIEHAGGLTFKTRAERLAALEKVRADMGKQAPVEAIHGRS